MKHIKALSVILTFFVSIILFIQSDLNSSIVKKVPSSPIKPNLEENQVPNEDKNYGIEVEWIEFGKLNNLENSSWGVFLSDIKNHVPKELMKEYDDQNTNAHEATHNINSYLNSIYGEYQKKYCFYVGGNKVAVITQPKLKISQIADIIPEIHRKSQYQLYLINQAKSWNDYPLYLMDEWVAYTNGAKTSVELIEKGLLKKAEANSTDEIYSVLQFNVYSLYVCMAAQKYDPNYDFKQLLEFVAWNCRNSMKVYHEGVQYKYFNWDNDEYLIELQTGIKSKDLRDFVIATYGEKWAKEVFNFTK